MAGLEPADPRLPELRRLWDQFRSTPVPSGPGADPGLQEVLLYSAWLTPLVESALARGGRLSASHARMLSRRRAEEGAHLWAAAGDLGAAGRAFVGRLKALEELLSELPVENQGNATT